MCHTGIFMCSLSSGQSLVIGPAAVEYLFEVWLCDFVVAQRVFPASQKAHSHLPAI